MKLPVLFIVALFPAFAPLSTANIQLPGISSESASSGKTAPSSSEPQLGEWLKEARASLAKLEEPAAESRLPPGVSSEALAERRRDLDQTIRTINRTLALSATAAEAEQAVKAARAADTAWTGFEETPPYSLLMVDDLLNQRDATREQETTFRSSISIFNRTLDGIQKEAKATEDRIAAIVRLIEQDGNDGAARWQLDAAREQSRLHSVRAVSTRLNIEILGHQADAAKSEIALLDRKITAASGNARLTDEDLAKIGKSADDRNAALQAEIAALRDRLRTASTERSRAKAALDQLTSSGEGEPSGDPALASSRLTAAESRVDTLQFISDNLENFQTLQSYLPTAYESRRTLLESASRTERDAALQSLQTLLERLDAWKIVSANELAAVNADISKLESVIDTLAAGDPRLPFLDGQRKDLWEKQSFLQRISQTVATHRKAASRWLQDYDQTAATRPWYARLSESGASTWNLLKRIWTFEVTSSEQVRDVAGVPVKYRQSITLGAILSALVFFIVAYILSARTSRRLQNVVVRRGHIAEAQAGTLRTWLMIVVGFLLFITTLHFLNIPLTVFAFFGGALAIGLGFGTQTLIKNFISGIIVLFERKIRVGDIVTVGNVTGTIAEINTRSSILRGGDGMETLIPNSVFLENQIANLTLSNRRSRRQMKIGVAYDSDPRLAAAALKECFERHGLVIQEPPPQILLDDFADSALLFTVFYWIEFNAKTDGGVVASDLRFMIIKRFAELGIRMPYPQRDIHLPHGQPLSVRLTPPDSES